ncbi:hypothetical protein PSTG_13577 [Puccinia striiformis f. sp. tritici PST-78]|uniref:Uncharacterized protein n=1 Tax=Puccinia striiformis f. sp. tritici PST-78 TaxID=1165861 RepID=A0A0L0V1M1_9BASI|nr:hypothetical protein PSTG_13577 [Puccinia striiformis f. sp. tritici PST-78]
MSRSQVSEAGPSDLLANDTIEENEADQDPERVGLLDGQYQRILERKPTTIELRLAILAFFCLCLASIGFGLFAGELAKFNRSNPGSPHNGNDPPVKIVTTTVYLSPTGTPSPPKKPSTICSTGPCVDAAGELRKTTQWNIDPCKDFAKFSTIGIRPSANAVIKARIDSEVEYILRRSTDVESRSLYKIQKFKSLCEKKGRRPPYTEYNQLLDELSEIWNQKAGSASDRIGSVLAYLHSASLPALFKTTLSSGQLTLKPTPIKLDGISEAFEAIYPPEEVLQRLQAVRKLVTTLSRLADHPGTIKSLSIDKLQVLSCSTAALPCWIHWKDFYSALDPDEPPSSILVHGLEYFTHLARVIAEQTEIGLESYFHWILIVSMRRENCLETTQLAFGATIAKHLYLNTDQQIREMEYHIRSARFMLHFMLIQDPSYKGLPRMIESPPIEPDQSLELETIGDDNDNWVPLLFELERIKTKKEFSEGEINWNLLGSEPTIMGDYLYLPIGALQTPLLYPTSVDLPKSLIFGSFGFILFDQLRKLQSNSTMDLNEKECQDSISTSFSYWKDYKSQHRSETQTRLVGLPLEIAGANYHDQLLFLAFGRLGLSCPGLQNLPIFINAFNCPVHSSPSYRL